MPGRAAPPPGALSQRVAAVLRGRKAELQVTDKQIGDAVGVSQEQISRYLKPSRVMSLDLTQAVCDYLGLDLPAALRGERKLVMPPTSDSQTTPSGDDVRALITWLLDHPDKDGVLQTRLGDLRRQTGLSSRRLAGVKAEMVNTRRRELERALAELDPGDSPPAQAN